MSTPWTEEPERPVRLPPAGSGLRSGAFDDVVDALCGADESTSGRPRSGFQRRVLPSQSAVEGILENLRAALFPRHFGGAELPASMLRHHVGARLEEAHFELVEQVRRGLSFACRHPARESDGRCEACSERALDVSRRLVTRLPELRALLESDARAAFEGDPAARFLDETLFCYPGMTAILAHRIAHEIERLAVPLIPRIIAELAHGKTGIDIHPGAQIGASFFIDHGTGVVIGETCTIGERVRIYQGVTLGARGFSSDEHGHLVKGTPRHPIVEDDVVIYAGATILGRITIGRGARIGGNVWLTHSVAPGSQISQAQVRQRSFRDGAGI